MGTNSPQVEFGNDALHQIVAYTSEEERLVNCCVNLYQGLEVDE